jgi:hypothetical protein
MVVQTIPNSNIRLFSPAKLGTQVIIPYRDEDEARLFKPMGDLGQIVRMASHVLYLAWQLLNSLQEWDIRNEDQIAECLKHSDIVYNLVGRDYETKLVIELYFVRALRLLSSSKDLRLQLRPCDWSRKDC